MQFRRKTPSIPVSQVRVQPSSPVTDSSNLVPSTSHAPQPINGRPSGLNVKRPWLHGRKLILLIAAIIVGLVVVAAAVMALLYRHDLSAAGTNKNQYITVAVEQNMSPTAIGTMLQDKQVIRSALAFNIYTRLSKTRGELQAGTYKLTPSETTQQIVAHLTSGTVDSFNVTFLPGATLAENKQVLLDAGYSQADIDSALSATYTGTLFANKPASADLEGYIYGDTYQFNAGATVADILQRTFDEYTTVIADNNLVADYAAHGLTLYEGITLASIIQREVSSSSDQSQVAQVFYLRLSTGVALGSDVTYQYAAKKLGVTATPTLDSPYNTRINVGLPPGPISVPGKSALLAVANPASGDYLFFLSGDDGKTYFAHTDTEHQANIANYCKVKCSE